MTQPISETKHGSNWNAVALDLAKENDRLRAEKAELAAELAALKHDLIEAFGAPTIPRPAIAANETEPT